MTSDSACATTMGGPLAALALRGQVFTPALFCAPLAELTHAPFRQILAEFGGCGAQFTEMLSGRKLLEQTPADSPYVRRGRGVEKLIFQLMIRATDPMDRIVGRAAELAPDGLDLNLACYAPVIRKMDAGGRLFENLPALTHVLQTVRRHWPGLLTVKIRLGSSTVGAEDRFVERLRVIEESGVDAITLHTRFLEDKFKRRARHELFAWAAAQTRLPVIANGDITGPETMRRHPVLFASVAGLMIGRMAIARPWLFAAWNKPLVVDHAEVWLRLFHYLREDFPEPAALRRIRLFTRYFARNFLFGHTLETVVQNAPTMEIARVRAEAFLHTQPELVDEPSLMGL